VTFKISSKLASFQAPTHTKPAEYRFTKSAVKAFDKRTQMNLVSQMRKGPGGPTVFDKPTGGASKRSGEGYPSTSGR
jgi:hypothetical protein